MDLSLSLKNTRALTAVVRPRSDCQVRAAHPALVCRHSALLHARSGELRGGERMGVGDGGWASRDSRVRPIYPNVCELIANENDKSRTYQGDGGMRAARPRWTHAGLSTPPRCWWQVQSDHTPSSERERRPFGASAPRFEGKPLAYRESDKYQRELI